MYLLDTNVVSFFDLRPRREAENFVTWARRHDRLIYISAITLTEIETGILKLVREGKDRRAHQISAFRDSVIADYRDRLLPLDIEVALTIARLVEAARPMVIELADLIIAATARVHNLTVLTRNIRHFAPTGVAAVDPLTTLPSAD